MKKRSGLILLLISAIFLLASCGAKLNVSVNVVNNENIEISNVGKKDATNIEVILYSDTDMSARAYKKVIEKISANETVTISAQELLNKKGASYPTGEKIKSINFYDAKSADKLLCSWKYTPVYSNPAGYTFSDTTVRIQFYKYFNDGKTFKVSYRTASGSWYDSDSGHYLYDGTYSMENGTIIMKCGDTIWEGLLEDDDLTLKLNGKYPENATAGIMLLDNSKLKREKGLDINVKNLQENEKFSNYEDTLLLMIVQNFNGEELINNYADIYHHDEYTKSKDDEFIWHDLKAQYKKELNEKIANVKKDLTVRVKWTLGDYDFAKENFKVDFSDGLKSTKAMLPFAYNEFEGSDLNLQILEKKYRFLTQSVTITVPSRWGPKPLTFYLPMEKSKAQEFLNNRKDENGKTDKSVLCVIHYKAQDYYHEDLFESLNGRSYDILGTFYKIDVYDNEDDMNLLYTGSVK